MSEIDDDEEDEISNRPIIRLLDKRDSLGSLTEDDMVDYMN